MVDLLKRWGVDLVGMFIAVVALVFSALGGNWNAVTAWFIVLVVMLTNAVQRKVTDDAIRAADEALELARRALGRWL